MPSSSLLLRLRSHRTGRPRSQASVEAPYDRAMPSVEARKQRKNSRERARRHDIKYLLDVLGSLLELNQKGKSEKYIVLNEAIQAITNLRKQVEELTAEKLVLYTRLQAQGMANPLSASGPQSASSAASSAITPSSVTSRGMTHMVEAAAAIDGLISLRHPQGPGVQGLAGRSGAAAGGAQHAPGGSSHFSQTMANFAAAAAAASPSQSTASASGSLNAMGTMPGGGPGGAPPAELPPTPASGMGGGGFGASSQHLPPGLSGIAALLQQQQLASAQLLQALQAQPGMATLMAQLGQQQQQPPSAVPSQQQTPQPPSRMGSSGTMGDHPTPSSGAGAQGRGVQGSGGVAGAPGAGGLHVRVQSSDSSVMMGGVGVGAGVGGIPAPLLTGRAVNPLLSTRSDVMGLDSVTHAGGPGGSSSSSMFSPTHADPSASGLALSRPSSGMDRSPGVGIGAGPAVGPSGYPAPSQAASPTSASASIVGKPGALAAPRPLGGQPARLTSGFGSVSQVGVGAGAGGAGVGGQQRWVNTGFAAAGGPHRGAAGSIGGGAVPSFHTALPPPSVGTSSPGQPHGGSGAPASGSLSVAAGLSGLHIGAYGTGAGAPGGLAPGVGLGGKLEPPGSSGSGHGSAAMGDRSRASSSQGPAMLGSYSGLGTAGGAPGSGGGQGGSGMYGSGQFGALSMLAGARPAATSVDVAGDRSRSASGGSTGSMGQGGTPPGVAYPFGNPGMGAFGSLGAGGLLGRTTPSRPSTGSVSALFVTDPSMLHAGSGAHAPHAVGTAASGLHGRATALSAMTGASPFTVNELLLPGDGMNDMKGE